MGSDAVSHGLASLRSGPVRKYCRGQVQDRDGDPVNLHYHIMYAKMHDQERTERYGSSRDGLQL